MALKTEDCRKWLAKNSEVQQLVQDRYGWDSDPAAMLEMCDGDKNEVAYIKKVVASAKKPDSWKRTAKYALGSTTDQELRDYASGQLHDAQGVIRHFELKNTEIVLVILEQNDQLQLLDDWSD